MAGKLDRLSWLAAALVAVVLVGVLTPLCTMPECDDVAAGTCSDFQPACDQCPDSVVMKHTHDDAVRSASLELDELVAVAQLAPVAEPVITVRFLPVPDVTASPPPLDPLGVRLSV